MAGMRSDHALCGRDNGGGERLGARGLRMVATGSGDLCVEILIHPVIPVVRAGKVEIHSK
jgi:hypothetical protein